MVVLIRILLLLLPVVGVVLWLRWRAKRKAGEEISDAEYLKLQFSLGGLALLLLMAGLALRFAGSGDSGQGKIYVPAKVVDGELIDGHFIDAPITVPATNNPPQEAGTAKQKCEAGTDASDAKSKDACGQDPS